MLCCAIRLTEISKSSSSIALIFCFLVFFLVPTLEIREESIRYRKNISTTHFKKSFVFLIFNNSTISIIF